MANPIEAAQEAYKNAVAEATDLSGRLSLLQSAGVLWNDPQYQNAQQQYNALTNPISGKVSQLFSELRTLQNQSLGIIESSGAALTPAEQAQRQTGNGTPTYVQSLANQGVSVTPLGNLLQSSPAQQYNRAAEQVIPNPQPTAPSNQANIISNMLQQAGFAPASARIAGEMTSQVTPSAYTTQYAPYGERTQQELLNTRLAVDKASGELGYYQVPINPMTGLPRTGIYGIEGGGILIGGGGRYAAQSGMFSTGVAGTPDIRTQYNPEKYAPTAAVPLAEQIRANPLAYSRLGAEAYFGQVAPLDTRKLTPESQVSRYPSWTGNVANLVQQVAPSKSDYSGANIPWAIPLSSPDTMYMGIGGIYGAAPSAYDRKASMEYTGPLFGMGSRAGIQNPTVEAPRLIIGEAGGTRYGESIVTKSDRLVGSGKVASVPVTEQKYSTTSAGYEAAMATGVVPKPFVSGTVTKPTGEVFGYKIPVVSDILAFVSPSTFVSGRASSVTEVNPRKTGGLDYANVFIQPETQQPTRTLVEKVGGPTASTSINPDTGKLETTITQELKTTTLPETKTVFGFTGVQQKSGYDQFLDENFRKYIPDVKTGETALRVSSAVNPVSAPSVISSAILERVAPDKAAAAQYFEPLKGQYALFYERPETAVTSAAVGGAFGLGTRGLSAVASRVPILAEASPAVKTLIGGGLAAYYGGTVIYESTGGLKDFSAEAAGRIKARAVQEAYPMTIGFGAGYALPETSRASVSKLATTMSGEPGITSEIMQASTLDKLRSSIPTYTGLKSKYIEMTTPQTAMAGPSASERYIKSGAERSLSRYGTTSRVNPALAENKANVEFYRERLQSRPSGQMSAQNPMLRIMGEQPRESRIGVTAMGGKSEIIGFYVQESPLISMRDVARIGQSKIAGMLAQFQKAPAVKTPYTGVETKTPEGVLVSKVESVLVSAPMQTLKSEATFAPLQQRGRLRYSEQEQVYYRIPEGMTRPSPKESTVSLTRMQPELAVTIIPSSALATGVMQLQKLQGGLQNVFSTKSQEIGTAVKTELSRTQDVTQRSRAEQEQRSGISEDQIRKTSAGILTVSRQTPISERVIARSGFIETPTPRSITTPITTRIPERTTTTPPGEVPPFTPRIPVPPILPGWGATSTPQGGRAVRRGVFTELFRVGTGIGQIRVTKQQRATQSRSVGVSIQKQPQGLPPQRRPKKLRF